MHFSKHIWIILFILLGSLFWTACPDDEMDPTPPPEINSFDQKGFFIVNSGGQSANGSISYYHREYGLVKNKIFQDANAGDNLGFAVNAMELINDKAYIVASGSDKIIIANPSTMAMIGEITGFDNPRNILAVNPDRAYVSQWGYEAQYGSIQIVNLNTNSIVDSIPVRLGPEEMLKLGNSVYVTNTGGLLIDSVVTKISVSTDQVLSIIEVGKTPTYLEVDKNLDLWVLSRGVILDPNSPENNIPGQLVRIKNDQVNVSIPVRAASGPLSINKDFDKLYFVQSGWVYEHPIENTSLALFPYIERYYSAIDVDPLTGAFIGADPIDFIESSVLYLFDEEKTPLDTAEIGKGPVGYTFF
jgi:hypothetical protein